VSGIIVGESAVTFLRLTRFRQTEVENLDRAVEPDLNDWPCSMMLFRYVPPKV